MWRIDMHRNRETIITTLDNDRADSPDEENFEPLAPPQLEWAAAVGIDLLGS